MEFTQPANGQTFDRLETVHFIGTAEPEIAAIEMTADDTIVMGSAQLTGNLSADGKPLWVFNKRFQQKGKNRKITAVGRNSDGDEVGRAECKINIAEPHLADYAPPADSLPRLAGIMGLLEDIRTERIATNLLSSHEAGARRPTLFTLPDGQLYFDANLDLDTDGSPFSEGDTHQGGTSLAQKDGETGLDANVVPFFVLPKDGFAARFGIKLGDVAAVISGSRVAFAIFADAGPTDIIGEGSIQLHRLLGFERIRPNGKVLDTDIPRVVTIVFPNSGGAWTTGRKLKFTQSQTITKATAAGKTLFTALGGAV